jgi:hypothetical protein
MLTPEQSARIREYVKQTLLSQWIAEGHYLTGKLITDLDFVVYSQVGIWTMEVHSYKYAVYMEKGVSAERIPFDGTRHKEKSLYIEGLMDYVERRMHIMKGSKENLSVAFAIAYKHHRYGMPLRTMGQGTKWLSKAYPKMEIGITQMVDSFMGYQARIILEDLVNAYEQTAKAA